MPINIQIELEGVKTINRRINGVIRKTRDFTTAFEKIGKDFRKTEERVFKGQGSYGSRPRWKALSPKYKEWKQQNFPGKPILQRTGSLMASLTKRSGQHVEIIRPKSITIGSSNPTMKYHQKTRPPITFTNYQGQKWAKIIRDDILKGAKK